MKALFLLGLAIAAAGQLRTPTFRARSEAVIVDVSVTDGSRPVTNLRIEEFELRDNGVLQEIRDMSRESLPIDLSVIADTSGSMSQSDRVSVSRAIDDLRRSLGPEDRMTFLAFGSHVVERGVGGSGTLDLERVGLSTALFDALLLSYSAPIVAGRRHVTVVMTDGADAGSYFPPETVLRTARYASASVFMVLTTNRASRSDREVLEKATGETGGRLFVARDFKELGPALLQVLTIFRTSYVLRYEPADPGADGWHDITVTVPGRKYSIRARPGYLRPTGG